MRAVKRYQGSTAGCYKILMKDMFSFLYGLCFSTCLCVNVCALTVPGQTLISCMDPWPFSVAWGMPFDHDTRNPTNTHHFLWLHTSPRSAFSRAMLIFACCDCHKDVPAKIKVFFFFAPPFKVLNCSTTLPLLLESTESSGMSFWSQNMELGFLNLKKICQLLQMDKNISTAFLKLFTPRTT